MPKPLLIRRPSGLYVRLRVPAALRATLGRRFIVRSLGGLRGDAARLAAARMGYAFGLAWQQGRPMPSPDDDTIAISMSGPRTPDGETAPAARAPAVARFDLQRGADGALRLTTLDTDADRAAGLRALELLAPAPALPPRKHSRTLIRAAAGFMRWFKGTKRAPGTILDTHASLRLLIAVVGPKVPVADLTPASIDPLLTLLPRIPPNASKRKVYKGLTPKQAASLALSRGDPGLSFRTQEKHLDRLRVFFGWLEERSEIDRSPIRTVHVLTRDADETRTRRGFTPAELATLFAPERRAALEVPAHWWGPLIALYTGARETEIAQLWTDDVEEIGGIWGLHFAVHHRGQRIKNGGASVRFVPLPPALLDAGIVAYRDHAAAFIYGGDGPLFPNLAGHATAGDSLGDWFNRTYLRRTCAITDPRVVFHSFRHTFASRAERVGILDPRIARLSGHSGAAKSSVLRAHYIDPPTLPERAADIARIVYPDLPPIAPYKVGQFKRHFSLALAALHHERAKARRRSR